MSNDHTKSTLGDLLTDEERNAVEQAIHAAGAYSVANPDSVDVLCQHEHVYLEARLSGLCREGALELLMDAASMGRLTRG